MKSKVLAAILVAAALVAAAFLLLRPREGMTAEIWLDGELVESIDLRSLTGPVEIPVGDGNTVLAEPGRVRMLHADCPDQLCVRYGTLTRPGETMACVPEKIVVRLRGGTADGVTG